ncbi:MAG: hypothetical protein ACLUOI_37275 [Eisenbergiella sp.]
MKEVTEFSEKRLRRICQNQGGSHQGDHDLVKLGLDAVVVHPSGIETWRYGKLSGTAGK